MFDWIKVKFEMAEASELPYNKFYMCKLKRYGVR